MTDEQAKQRVAVAVDRLPPDYPTQLHTAEFWTALGRTVATFGFLEATLARAIFAFTGMREIPEEEAAEEVKKWGTVLTKAISDPLGNLITAYRDAIRSHGEASITNLDDLVDDLRAASKICNVICHGFWQPPDENGSSLPQFVNKKLEMFDTPIDIQFLNRTRTHVVRMACAVIDTVTSMGWQFPGTAGPGTPLWSSNS